jgi:outer membrane protein assembly factor BamD (BamD/ComL family)
MPAAGSASELEPKATRALGEQVALIDRARKAVEGGDAAAALRTLDDYDARFAQGALSQEATVLRIQALLKQGRRQDAQRLGDAFIAARPKSPYATKIHHLLDNPQ